MDLFWVSATGQARRAPLNMVKVCGRNIANGGNLMKKTMFLIVVFGLTASLWAADPCVGTWKLNLGKSKFDPGPPPKSAMVKIEAQENGLKIVADSVNAEGKPLHQELDQTYDGKEHFLIGTGVPPDITVSYKKINANTFDSITKQGGKDVQTARVVVSKDGKTITRTSKGKNAQGQAFNNIQVYDRQ